MFEIHITLDPIFDQEAKAKFKFLIEQSTKFKVAKLFMEKDTPSDLDTFITGHAEDLPTAISMTEMGVNTCIVLGQVVRRYKIESILIDSKYQDDPLNLNIPMPLKVH